MDRRGDRRALRRFRVAFWERGATVRQVGFTVNISATGMFIATNRPLTEGTRLRLQVGPEGRDFILEAEVIRARKVQQHLQSIAKSGMGVRFLSVTELVTELAPEIGSTASNAAAAQRPPEDGVYRVVFNERQQLLGALESDIKNGWLYVPTRRPAEVEDVVEIELAVKGYESDALRLEARVVERFEPTIGSDDQPNLLAGMGVQVSAFEGAMQKVLGLLARIPS